MRHCRRTSSPKRRKQSNRSSKPAQAGGPFPFIAGPKERTNEVCVERVSDFRSGDRTGGTNQQGAKENDKSPIGGHHRRRRAGAEGRNRGTAISSATAATTDSGVARSTSPEGPDSAAGANRRVRCCQQGRRCPGRRQPAAAIGDRIEG